MVVDPRSNRVTARVSVGTGSVGFACGRSLWTARYGDGQLLRLDPRTGKITGRVTVGFQPRAIVLTAGAVWVANQASGTVSRVTP